MLLTSTAERGGSTGSRRPSVHELLHQESDEDVGGLASSGHAAKLPGEIRHPGLEELQLIDRLRESVEHVPDVGFIIAAPPWRPFARLSTRSAASNRRERSSCELSSPRRAIASRAAKRSADGPFSAGSTVRGMTRSAASCSCNRAMSRLIASEGANREGPRGGGQGSPEMAQKPQGRVWTRSTSSGERSTVHRLEPLAKANSTSERLAA